MDDNDIYENVSDTFEFVMMRLVDIQKRLLIEAYRIEITNLFGNVLLLWNVQSRIWVTLTIRQAKVDTLYKVIASTTTVNDSGQAA